MPYVDNGTNYVLMHMLAWHIMCMRRWRGLQVPLDELKIKSESNPWVSERHV